MKIIWIIAVIFVIIDCIYLMTYFGRVMQTLDDIRKDTRELIVRARREEEYDRDHTDGEM